MRAVPLTVALLVLLALKNPSAVICGASWALLSPKAKQSLRQAPTNGCTEGAFAVLSASNGLTVELAVYVGAALRASGADAMLLSASFWPPPQAAKLASSRALAQ